MYQTVSFGLLVGFWGLFIYASDKSVKKGQNGEEEKSEKSAVAKRLGLRTFLQGSDPKVLRKISVSYAPSDARSRTSKVGFVMQHELTIPRAGRRRLLARPYDLRDRTENRLGVVLQGKQGQGGR